MNVTDKLICVNTVKLVKTLLDRTTVIVQILMTIWHWMDAGASVSLIEHGRATIDSTSRLFPSTTRSHH